MRFRKLRIAWSVGVGLGRARAADRVVREAAQRDSFDLQVTKSHPLRLYSVSGSCILNTGYDISSERRAVGFWEFRHHHFDPEQSGNGHGGDVLIDFFWENLYLSLVVPHWLLRSQLLLLPQSLGSVGRFSLRTLLIATTLVAVVLGLIDYAAR